MTPLIVFAMKEESQDVFSDYNVLHTGIGKVNAAYGLMNHIAAQGRPDLVVNMGTAGSPVHKPRSIVNPVKFIQRDMDVRALGFEKYKTPFSDDPPVIEYGRRIAHLPEAICGSGDHFDVSGANQDYDVADMEAYALALICQRENLPFLCLKYISDGADDDSTTDWYEALHDTAEALRAALQDAL